MIARQRRGQDLVKIAKLFADYGQRQGNMREQIRQQEVEKLQKERKQFMDAQWESQEKEIRQETLDQLEHQKSHLQEKEREWAEKIKQQEKLSRHLEEKCRKKCAKLWQSMTG